MFNLDRMHVRPYIGRFGGLDGHLTHAPADEAPKRSGLRAGLHALGSHMPGKKRARAEVDGHVLDALKLSQSGHADAPLVWRNTCDVALGADNGVRFSLNAAGHPDRSALIRPGHGGGAAPLAA